MGANLICRRKRPSLKVSRRLLTPVPAIRRYGCRRAIGIVGGGCTTGALPTKKGYPMGFDQKGNVVLRVVRGANHKWDVTEQGLEKALASFDREIDAIHYAKDLAKTKQGTRV